MKTRISLFIILSGYISCLTAQNDNNKAHVFKKHSKPVLSVSFSRDGKFLASGSEDKAIYVWDISSFELVHSIENNYFPIRALQFARENEILAACGPDIKLMNLEEI